jgi:hypothetical protein
MITPRERNEIHEAPWINPVEYHLEMHTSPPDGMIEPSDDCHCGSLVPLLVFTSVLVMIGVVIWVAGLIANVW